MKKYQSNVLCDDILSIIQEYVEEMEMYEICYLEYITKLKYEKVMDQLQQYF